MSERVKDEMSFDDLCAWLGYKNKQPVLKWLRDNGVQHWFDSKGRPITTLTDVRKGRDAPAEVRLSA